MGKKEVVLDKQTNKLYWLTLHWQQIKQMINAEAFFHFNNNTGNDNNNNKYNNNIKN